MDYMTFSLKNEQNYSIKITIRQTTFTDYENYINHRTSAALKKYVWARYKVMKTNFGPIWAVKLIQLNLKVVFSQNPL